MANTTHKILIIEDEMEIAHLISYTLRQERMNPLHSSNGRAGIDMAKRYKPVLIVLDLMLPDVSGLEVCRILKSDPKTSHIPIIMLTAKAEEVDRIVGLEMGADDYVTKPFSPRELALRIKSILKRDVVAKPAEPSNIKIGELEINPDEHTVTIGKKRLDLTLIEFKLLQYLVTHKEKAVARDTILNHVWGYEADVFSRTVDTHITRLREKLGRLGKHLITVRGIGYKWS